MKADEELIKGCRRGSEKEQRLLYRKYSARMYGICLRYMKNEDEAKDVLQDGFIKVFTKLKEYRGEGSFEGWIRRIMVNTAINMHIKNKKFNLHTDIDKLELSPKTQELPTDGLHTEELLRLIQDLPSGYRTVFNLYEIEGYAHKEIAEMLGVSINTSKTQLMHAKRSLQKRLHHLQKERIKRENE